MTAQFKPYFDLLYIKQNGESTVSCAVFKDDGTMVEIGPFPAKEAAPKIVDALLSETCLQFKSRKQAEDEYVVIHMRNMVAKSNLAGVSYPYVITNQ